jgi:diguanylate cyclase (GGDEF)-like protein
MTAAAAASVLAERLRKAIAEFPWPLEPITASLGVASLTGAVNPRASNLLEQADRALYHSKNQGRNRVSHHDDLIRNGFVSPFYGENGKVEVAITATGRRE